MGSTRSTRSTRTGLVAGALALVVGAGAGVGAAPVAARAEDCARATTQTDLNICSGQARVAADEALNAAYGALVREPTEAERLDRLRAAERAWVAFRDAQCAFEGAAYEGGSMQPMVVNGCAEALTKRRTAELRKALACAKGGEPC